jgi:hypothetical protein
MPMNGNTLGTAIGTAFYNAIPQSVKNCMSSSAKTEMCSALIDNAKIIANCVVAHIQQNAQVTVSAGIAVTAGSCVGATTGTGSGTIS